MRYFLRLLVLFRPYWGWAVAGILVSLISLMANIALLSVSGWFIATMGLAGITGGAVNYFTPGAIIRACAILRTGGRYVERLITHEATFRFMGEMRSWLYERIERMPLSKSSQYHSGDLLARLRGDVDALEAFYIGIVIPSCVAFLALIIITISFAIYSPLLALIELFLLVLAGVVIPYIAYRKGRVPAHKIIEQKSALKVHMVDNIQSLAEMTIYGTAMQRMDQAMELSDEIIEDQRKLGIMDGVSQGVNGFITNMGLWIALVIALILYQQKLITQPQVPMLFLLAMASFESVIPLSLAFQSLESSLQAAKRLFALDEGDSNTRSTTDTLPSQNIQLRMENICFSYPNRPNVLKDFNLHLQSAQMLTLTGPSGMGKSSIIHLLTGLYQADSGSITLNGLNYDQMNMDDVRQYFSVVSQNPYLFIGTLRTNLKLAKADATDEELDHACEIACLDGLIQSLPQGYDTYVGEGGTTLSGGEIRRLAIARAVLRDAPCLLLDEPTEGLDDVTKSMLMQRLVTYSKNKAVLLITHEKN